MPCGPIRMPVEEIKGLNRSKGSFYDLFRPFYSLFDILRILLKNCSVTFFPFQHIDSRGCYEDAIKSWMPLNRSKGHFTGSKQVRVAFPMHLNGDNLHYVKGIHILSPYIFNLKDI